VEILEVYFRKIPDWLRWILILPFSVLSYLLTTVASNILGKVIEFFSRDPVSEKVFTHLLSPGFAGFMAIAVVIVLAPNAKQKVAFAVTGLWLIFYGASSAFAILIGDWKSTIPVLVSTGTSIWSYMQFKSKVHYTEPNE